MESEIKDWHAPIIPPPKERKDERLAEHERPHPPAASNRGNPQSEVRAGTEPRTPTYERREAPLSPPSEKRFVPSAPARPLAAPPSAPPLSLANLRPGAKKVQGGEGAHLSELRKALSAVIQSATNEMPAAVTSPPAHVRPETKESSLPSGEAREGASLASSTHGRQVPEIPEDLLRKLLTVQNPAQEKGTDPASSSGVASPA